MTLSSSLWDYALDHYARPGVAAACLDVQDKFGVDVPMLLYASWMGARGRVLGREGIAHIDESLRDWRAEVILPLRQIRTRMKSGPFPAPTAQTDSLREKIKAAELGAEKIELEVLQARFGEFGASGHPPADAIRGNLDAVLTHFSGEELSVPVSDAIGHLRATLSAPTF